MKRMNILLFTDFESLDVFGPVEAFGMSGQYDIRYVSMDGGLITNRHGIRIETEKAEPVPGELWLIPGGPGTRPLAKDPAFIERLDALLVDAGAILTVCTGSALLACTGRLDGRKATSNKNSFEWVKSCGRNTDWQREARWVKDGSIYTSAGVSAGIDMALGWLEDTLGPETAQEAADRMEYHRNTDADHDDF